MDLSELTMTMNLQAITCVVDHHYKTQYRPSPDELNVCGNVAILYGCRSCDSTVTVHYGDVIGVYNYIDGTVKSNLDSMDEEANLVSLGILISLPPSPFPPSPPSPLSPLYHQPFIVYYSSSTLNYCCKCFAG